MALVERICAVALISIFFGECGPGGVRAESAPGQQLLFPPANTPEARLVRVQIGPHIFDIPRNARDIERDRTGKLDAMSMQVLFPTMEGFKPEVGRRMIFSGQQARDLQVLLSYREEFLKKFAASQLQLAHLWSSLTDEIPFGADTASSLHKLLKESDRLRLLRISAFSLTEFKLTSETPKSAAARFHLREGRTLFADIASDDVRSVITCNGQQNVPNPQCTMDFTYRSLDVRVHFVQALLPDWRAIRDGFSRYLDERCINC